MYIPIKILMKSPIDISICQAVKEKDGVLQASCQAAA